MCVQSFARWQLSCNANPRMPRSSHVVCSLLVGLILAKKQEVQLTPRDQGCICQISLGGWVEVLAIEVDDRANA